MRAEGVAPEPGDHTRDVRYFVCRILPASRAAAPPSVTDAASLRLLEAIGLDPCDLDTLAARSGMSAAEISALITQLEIDGLVAALPGGRFQRIR